MVADESVKSEVVTCPDCQEQFFPLLPPAPKLPPPPAPAIVPPPPGAVRVPAPVDPAIAAADAEHDRLKALAAQISSLHSIGDALTGFGVVIAVLGFLIALGVSANNMPGDVAAIAIGAGLGCALTVVVVGQLFHIRASVLHLEK